MTASSTSGILRTNLLARYSRQIWLSARKTHRTVNGRKPILDFAWPIYPFGSLFSNDLAIDMGTVNTRIYIRDKGIEVNEPSAVAIDADTRKIEAIGKEAKAMMGRTPGSKLVIRPMKDGVIADFKAAQAMLRYFIHKAQRHTSFVHPRVVIGVPSDITEVEKRAVMDSAYRAKASDVYLVEQPMMAALGTDMPISAPGGNMIVDIGGGTTDIAVVSLSGMVYSRSVRIGGNHMDQAIAAYLKRKHNLLVGDLTAEKIKIRIGSAWPTRMPQTMEVKGRDLIEGLPRTVTVQDSEIREALNESLSIIFRGIRTALERTPPELSADIAERGIVLTGGGALLSNLERRVREELGLPVCLADQPLCSVALGEGKVLRDSKLLRRMAIG